MLEPEGREPEGLLAFAEQRGRAAVAGGQALGNCAPARPMPIEGTTRKLTYRKLTYVLSKNEVIAACEDGKLAGEVTRGTTIVRAGDLELARELEKRFR